MYTSWYIYPNTASSQRPKSQILWVLAHAFLERRGIVESTGRRREEGRGKGEKEEDGSLTVG